MLKIVRTPGQFVSDLDLIESVLLGFEYNILSRRAAFAYDHAAPFVDWAGEHKDNPRRGFGKFVFEGVSACSVREPELGLSDKTSTINLATCVTRGSAICFNMVLNNNWKIALHCNAVWHEAITTIAELECGICTYHEEHSRRIVDIDHPFGNRLLD